MRYDGNAAVDRLTAALNRATIPGLLAARARGQRDTVAFWQQRGGSWHSHTWGQYFDDVSRLARGLNRLGLAKGDRVAIMGDVSQEWLLADMAVVCAGSVSVGIYFTVSPEEADYALDDSGAEVLFVGSQVQLEIALRAKAGARLRNIIVMDPAWVPSVTDPRIISFAQLTKLGADVSSSVFEELMARVRADDLAGIGYTSGTTGFPKGVMLTHRALLFGALSTVVITPALLEHPYRVVVFLPLSHIVAKAQAFALPLMTKVVPYFGETTAKFADTLLAVRPTYYLGPPRFYQKFAAQLISSVNSGPALRRGLYRLAMRAAKAILTRRRAHRPLGPVLSVIDALSVTWVFRPLLAKVGFDQLRLPYTASAPMPDEVMAVWQMWGLNLKEGYGQTEMAGGSVAHIADWPAPGTIGVPIPHPAWETKILEDGEMILRCPALFVGYWNKPDETKSALRDGWLYTGDIVERQADGNLKLIDRKKEIINTAGGKSVSPAQIENELRQSPYISEAAVVGEGRKYLAALIEVDASAMSQWAQTRGISIGCFADFSKSDEVRALIENEVTQVNSRLSRVEQIKAFRVLPEELSPDLGVMTVTRKKKRRALHERYATLIDSMYDATEAALISKQL
jgi:long-chain acyl-CoA synthetase